MTIPELEDLIEAKRSELTTLEEIAEAIEDREAEIALERDEALRRAEDLKLSSWTNFRGLYWFHEKGFLRVSPEEPAWSSTDLQAWLKVAPLVDAVAGIIADPAPLSPTERAKKLAHGIIEELRKED